MHFKTLHNYRNIEIASCLWIIYISVFAHSLMELSPSWEAANCAATQELPSVLWNPKVHYRVHKSPLLVPILSQIDPIHIIPSFSFKIHFNIVHPPTSWSYQWSLSFWIPHQCIPRLPVRATYPARHYGMARPQVADGEDTFQVWRVAENILNKQWRTADKGWSSSLGVWRGANNSSP
jgi:hypothetical protein